MRIVFTGPLALLLAGCASQGQHVAAGPQFPPWCSQLARVQQQAPPPRDSRYRGSDTLPRECRPPSVDAAPAHPVPEPRRLPVPRSGG